MGNTKAVVAGVVGGLAGVLVAGLAAGGVYMYMRKKRVTLPLTRAKMAESASKRYSQFDGEQPRSTDPLPVDATTPVSVSAVTDASFPPTRPTCDGPLFPSLKIHFTLSA